MSAQLTKAIVKNLQGLNSNIASILQNSTLGQKHCQLLAVSKTKPVADIVSAYDAGQRHFGENYVDEFCSKAQELGQSHSDIKWHFIGHIQSNKAKPLVACLNLSIIETVDSVKLANTLNKECQKIEARAQMEPLDVLIQVLSETNTEGSKFGVSP